MAADLVITNARVLTRAGLSTPRTVNVRSGLIADHTDPRAPVFDAAGGALLPGLIDSHVHVNSAEQLAEHARWGVCTVLDMASADWHTTSGLRSRSDLPSVLSAGFPACAPRGTAVRSMGFPSSSAVCGPQDAARFVQERISQGVDYLKIVLDERVLPWHPKPLTPQTVDALVAAAHKAGLLAVVHATNERSFGVATAAGADVITHMPLASALSPEAARACAEDSRSTLHGASPRRSVAVCPTLVMMKSLIENFPAPIKPRRIRYDNVRDGVAALQAAGVAMLAGTDANTDPTAPTQVPHGSSLHQELGLLVDAGLSPLQALQAATTTPSEVFGLSDRGRIAGGCRADFVLVDGDPTRDITATQAVRRVWIAGRAVAA